MSAKSFWNDERDRKLRELHAQGLTGRKIGDQLGVSNVSVARRIKVLGLEPHIRLPPPVSKVAPVKGVEDAEPREAAPAAMKGGAHVRPYKRARRGFEVPAHLEDRYFELLKGGVPIAEACRQLGIIQNP
ncbi:hypothetical protein EHS39_32970 [Ensifer sp. MPMI2T]|nr:hypothetical protein EHS39_32970 [Ensifer sp. MPMI2T]